MGYSSYEHNVTVSFGLVSYDNMDLNRSPAMALSLNSLLELVFAFVGATLIATIVIVSYRERMKR